ncbi:Uncharacterized protein Zm00014a_023169 [Zea mays]|uniref:Uncharacterized protein n=1 Tax=Zea mays TaxID=4577 RepID=A0A3L6FGG6_MAIZE|nr:Uncharacterized protein Zm00014a_023169 [Zea mays]
MSWKRQKQDKDEMTEECCFICKDSGHDLRVCDSSAFGWLCAMQLGTAPRLTIHAVSKTKMRCSYAQARNCPGALAHGSPATAARPPRPTGLRQAPSRPGALVQHRSALAARSPGLIRTTGAPPEHHRAAAQPAPSLAAVRPAVPPLLLRTGRTRAPGPCCATTLRVPVDRTPRPSRPGADRLEPRRARGRSDYQCLCCPFYSVCSACLGKLEFVQLRKQNKGFCSSCLNLAIAIEKDDPHVELIHNVIKQALRHLIFHLTCRLLLLMDKPQPSKTDNYKILFKDYWEGIKDAEHLTLVDLEEASDILNRKLNCKGATLERFPADDHKLDENTSPDNGANDQTRFPADDLKTHENTSPDNGANDQTISFDSEGKQIKANTSRNNKSNKRTYVGWGSKELIGFLSSLGKDTSKSLDELEIIGVVKGYIKQKKLYQDDKKLRFLCDDKLQPLFTRRKVRCKMIRKFLAVHLASNAISEDERFCSYEDDDDALVIKKRPRNSLGPKIAKRVSERSKRHFASLTQNNINLIYLRKTLVISLLNQPDTFEQKVIGCFVRVRCGKKTHSYEIPKKAYLLGKVIGIKKSKNEYKINDTYTKILLCVTGLLDDVSVSMLSDEDLEEVMSWMGHTLYLLIVEDQFVSGFPLPPSAIKEKLWTLAIL